jgi:tRNA(Ile)-lysidine synthase TilS/MesJ
MMSLCGDFFMFILEDKILADAQGLFEGVERVLLAVSGGADSVAMAHVLAKLNGRPCESLFTGR